MRDAQSLLEQLLSFGGTRLTSELVHQSLGIAPDERVLDLLDALAERDAGRALSLLNESVGSGVQPVDLLNGLIEFVRDVMVVSAGAEVDTLSATPAMRPRLRAVADQWPLDTVLATLQILSETRARLRGSPHGRILIELALCRVARLEDFMELGSLVEKLAAIEGDSGVAPASQPIKRQGEPTAVRAPAPPGPPAASRASEPSVGKPSSEVPAKPESGGTGFEKEPPAPGRSKRPSATGNGGEARADARTRPRASAVLAEPEAGSAPLELDAVLRAWQELPGKVGTALGTKVSVVKPTAIRPPDEVVVELPARQGWVADQCERPEALQKIESKLGAMVGRKLRVVFLRNEEAAEAEASLPSTTIERADELAIDPMVQKVTELFDARRVRIDFDEDASDRG